MKKAIAYAYPTSHDAERFGFGELGCYTVEVWDGDDYDNNKPSRTVGGFESYGAALDYADNTEGSYTRYSLNVYNRALWNPVYGS